MKVKLADRSLSMKAPRQMVFQMLGAIGGGSLFGTQGDSSRVLERHGDTIIAEFLTTSGKRIYRTLEEVQLHPLERLTFRHLEGPLDFAEEEFSLDEQDKGTVVRYTGRIEYKVSWLPGPGWLIAMLYIRPKYNGIVRSHLEKLKTTAEARAARSHVFGRPEESQP